MRKSYFTKKLEHLIPWLITTARRSPAVALRRVFKSYDVYGPSVNLPALVQNALVSKTTRNKEKYFHYGLLNFQSLI